MPKWNRREERHELEAYEVDAYLLGRSLEEPRPQTRVYRREVHLDENGQPRVLVEEFIERED